MKDEIIEEEELFEKVLSKLKTEYDYSEETVIKTSTIIMDSLEIARDELLTKSEKRILNILEEKKEKIDELMEFRDFGLQKAEKEAIEKYEQKLKSKIKDRIEHQNECLSLFYDKDSKTQYNLDEIKKTKARIDELKNLLKEIDNDGK